jgi:hypothetical protein
MPVVTPAILIGTVAVSDAKCYLRFSPRYFKSLPNLPLLFLFRRRFKRQSRPGIVPETSLVGLYSWTFGVFFQQRSESENANYAKKNLIPGRAELGTLLRYLFS